MTTTHTPGPWSADWGYIVAPDVTGKHVDLYVATIAEEDEDGRVVPEHERDANARLIAAAPDLLAALRGVVLCADARGDAEPLDAYRTRAAMLPGQIARAYAAIARATGADA